MNLRRHDRKYREGEDIRPSNLPKTAVESYAERLAEAAELEPGDDPADIVRLLDCRIHYQDIEEWLDESGSIFVHGEADFDILLPRYTSPLRDRFTVAHELGHYFLHSKQGETPIIAYRQGSTRIEWEANWFAAALLMPQAEFELLWNQSHDLRTVAAALGVSTSAAEVRKEALGV